MFDLGKKAWETCLAWLELEALHSRLAGNCPKAMIFLLPSKYIWTLAPKTKSHGKTDVDFFLGRTQILVSGWALSLKLMH